MTTPMNELVQQLRRAERRHDGAGLTDGQLLACFIEQHDEAAIAALVRRHGSMVWGVCHRLLRNHHDTEDAFQATFLVLVRKAASVKPRERVGNWLYGVAYKTACKARGMIAKRRLRERQVTEMPEPPGVENNLWHDLEPLLDQELSGLPDKYRFPILLCDLEGKTYKEAARQIGCPEGTLAARLSKARTMLAKRLARHGLALTGGTLAAALTENAASACVPTSVVSSTIKVVTLAAAGKAAASGMISFQVAALTKGVLKAMLLSRVTTRMFVLLLVGLMGTTAGVGSYTVLSGAGEVPGSVSTAQGDKTDHQGRGGQEGAPPHLLSAASASPATETPALPTPEQLENAKQAFARLGATYLPMSNPKNMANPLNQQGIHVFTMPGRTTDDDLKKLPHVPFPFGLNLKYTQVTDDGLKELKDLKQLNWLEFPTEVTDAGLKELKDLKQLIVLYLWQTQVTDAGLKELKNFKLLAGLNLDHTKVTDAGLKELKGLKQLADLSLRQTQVTDAGLKELKDLKQLKGLELPSTKVTDAELKELKDLKQLIQLDLDFTKVADAGLKELKELKQLRVLYLDGTRVTDAGLKELKDLKQLSLLQLQGTQVTNDGVRALRKALPKCKIIFRVRR
jgi:RNA polymerase sigma factor (sigma-70 family)